MSGTKDTTPGKTKCRHDHQNSTDSINRESFQSSPRLRREGNAGSSPSPTPRLGLSSKIAYPSPDKNLGRQNDRSRDVRQLSPPPL